MAKAVLVTYLFALAIGSASTVAKDCAVGPEYWCRSFENARECGGVQHCVDTVWSHDEKYEKVESSTTCQWCQKILTKTYEGLGGREDMMTATLSNACNLLPTGDLQSKCTNTIANYGSAVLALMKKQRFGTLCRLMSVCSKDEKLHIVGKNRCAWGPSYWCSSLSNSRECQATEHCTNEVWSQQAIIKKANDNVCQYCEYIVDKARAYLADGKMEINFEQWLTGACGMLQNQDIVDKCKQTMSGYAKEILVLIKNNIHSGVICHLGGMCKDGTVTPREQLSQEQSQMLCNVLVQATHELSVNQKKSADEIEGFLRKDCQRLETSELKEKCEDLVEQFGHQIYERVGEHMELSEICDQTMFQPAPHAQCDLCTSVISFARAMLEDKHPKDEVIEFMDQKLCQRLNGTMKSNCQSTMKTHRQILIEQIQQGKRSSLICTYFQVCFKEIPKKEDIPKEELKGFYAENFCGQLGHFQEPCRALLEADSTGLFKSLVNDLDGRVLCQLFGICPTPMSLLDNLAVGDDKNKCKRCVDDFTRRKHIAEKLLNHSSEFLHHLCGQLPDKDQCTQSVEEPINKLVTFVQSLNPKDICEQLKFCNETLLEELQSESTDMAITNRALDYIDHEICAKSGPLSKWCHTVLSDEGPILLGMISPRIDPHQVCSIIDICPQTTAFDNCNDKCECCVSKVHNYQVQLAAFLNAMVSTAEDLCTRMSHSTECQQMANGFKTSVNGIISNFNAKQICELFTHCSASQSASDRCQTCQTNLNTRQGNFHAILTEISSTLHTFCSDASCRSKVQSTYQAFANQLDTIHSLTLCQRFGYCAAGDSQRSIPFLSDLMVKRYSDLNVAVDEISDTLCVRFGYCSKTNSTEVKPVERIDRSNSTCVLCEYVMNALSNYIQSNATEEEIEESLEQVCDGLPTVLQNLCREYVEDYSPTIISILTKDFNLTSVCRKLNLCTSQMKVEVKHLTQADASTCGVCDYVSTHLHFELQRDSSAQALGRALTTVCQHLSSEYHSKCQSLVQLFSPYIRQLELTPKKNFCKELPICQTAMSVLQPAKPLLEPVDALPKCTVCEFVMSYLDAALRNNISEQAIEEALSKVCTILPSAERDQCNQLVKTYGAVIAQMIAEAADPATICRRLGLCSEQKPQPSNGKCIFGMAFWCENRRNAELCDAVQLCERQVWSKKKPLIY